MAPFEIRRLRSISTRHSQSAGRLPKPGPGQHYLRGPVPLDWLCRAARLPGKSLHVGMAIWYSAGLNRSASVRLSNIAGHKFGLDRNSKYRALAWLEGADLIKVERKLGRAPIVTIVSAGASEHGLGTEGQSTPA